MTDEVDDWDKLAESWLIAQHSPDWYIGNASDDEWHQAYQATRKMEPHD